MGAFETCSARLFAGLATGFGLLAFSPGAQAYDRAVCNRMFASANVEKVETFKVGQGSADFGDEPHLFGWPQSTAVVCWSIDGRVGVMGKLYADSFREPREATVRIRFGRTNGGFTNRTKRSVMTQGFFLASREVEKVSPRGRFNRVEIELTSLRADQTNPPVANEALVTLRR